MALTNDQVKKVALLSRISLRDDEIEKFKNQLSAVLEYVEKLNEVDTSSVEPMITPTGLQDITREDLTGHSLTVDEATKNAPTRQDGYFKVPKVFE